jgi:multicomponent K+:H+ antiporter subunit E
MSLRRVLLPKPLTSLALVIVWLWLNDTLAAGQLILGIALGLLIPLFTRRFAPEPGPVRLARLPAYLALVLWDVLVANLQVAAQILGPVSRLRPGFVDVPLDLATDRAITVLASTITLTPGTVSCDLAPDRRSLRVHALSVADPDALVREIKQRYERRVKEIFECST